MVNIEGYGIESFPELTIRLRNLPFEIHLTRINSISYRLKDGVSTPYLRIISDKQEEIDEVVRALGAHCLRIEPILHAFL